MAALNHADIMYRVTRAVFGARRSGTSTGRENSMTRLSPSRLKWIKRALRVACLVSFALASVCCGTRPSSPEEELIRDAFNAIKKNDWKAYSKLTITTADFMLKEHEAGPFEEKQSYAGSILKPEEIERQRLEFDRAVAAGKGIIDFRKAQFVSLGATKETTSEELLTGSTISTTTHSVRIRLDGKETDSRELDPLFVTVKWGDEPRLLRLRFRD